MQHQTILPILLCDFGMLLAFSLVFNKCILYSKTNQRVIYRMKLSLIAPLGVSGERTASTVLTTISHVFLYKLSN
ncbi:hypothetical protein SD10_03835 [Spirosoma radiotolerans]|uniref:Uncharacterized protein n=1 Tax=Spirosoma radiotolerans TaxID=1379870 RepID=A0A0E3ZTQ7_9BACT|nr:hypothetical protein SD10_03835 [Spirosoma radiotolerans]